MSEVFAPVLFQLGVGGIGGFFIGYLIKKVVKLALLLGILVFLNIHGLPKRNYLELRRIS